MKKCTISFPVRKYGKIEVCKPSYTIAEFAEIITQRICDVYETDLFEWFCDSGYIEYKDVCNSYPNRELFDIGLLGTSTREERCSTKLYESGNEKGWRGSKLDYIQ